MVCIMKPQAAVLTGDLVGSTIASAERVEATMRHLADLAYRISPTTRFTRYRGDGWQIYLENPGSALTSLLFIWAGLRATRNLESRISVGLGFAPLDLRQNALATGQEAEQRLPSSLSALAPIGQQKAPSHERNALAISDLSGEMGAAFTASGRALDKMEKSQHIALAGQGVDLLHQRLFAMIEDRIMDWSVEQAEVMAMAFAPEGRMTQIEMAEYLNISRQAVAARLQAAGYNQLAQAALDFAATFGTGISQ